MKRCSNAAIEKLSSRWSVYFHFDNEQARNASLILKYFSVFFHCAERKHGIPNTSRLNNCNYLVIDDDYDNFYCSPSSNRYVLINCYIIKLFAVQLKHFMWNFIIINPSRAHDARVQSKRWKNPVSNESRGDYYPCAMPQACAIPASGHYLHQHICLIERLHLQFWRSCAYVSHSEVFHMLTLIADNRLAIMSFNRPTRKYGDKNRNASNTFSSRFINAICPMNQ